jgi:hypothetical protein
MNVMQKSGNFTIFLKSGELISAIYSTKIHCMCQNYNLKENSKHLPPKKTTGTYISSRASRYHIPYSWYLPDTNLKPQIHAKLLKQKKVVKKNPRMQFSKDKKKHSHTILHAREQLWITKDLLDP